MYAKRNRASHFRTWAIFAYGSHTVAAPIPTPNSTTKMRESNPVSISDASAIPEKSAPMLMMFAASRAIAATATTARGSFLRNA